MDYKNEIEKLRERALELIQKVDKKQVLNEVKAKFLGKKGEITLFLRNLGKLPPEERPIVGKLVNELKNEITNVVSNKNAELEEMELTKMLREEAIDVTLPGKHLHKGHRHPLYKVWDEIVDIFSSMGFETVDGPEIEFIKYNFDFLNSPAHHPSRDETDTFYIDDEYLMRTQTSPVQIRTMLKKKPPIRIISPGRVYRKDTPDASHSPVFHQVEALYVDKNVTFPDLKATLDMFVKKMFGHNTVSRFRPSYFPFTEPSAEVDISCVICGGKGCKLCKNTGWLEMGGAGMVNPKVLENVGYDSEKYTGFAFGLGIDRITLLKYGIKDIRDLFENNIKFLEKF